jgi:hypothetical protein
MEVQKDFRDLLELLNAHKVEYMIVGDYAFAFHAARGQRFLTLSIV